MIKYEDRISRMYLNMTTLYKKITVPDFEVIRLELLEIVAPQISQNLKFWDLPFSEFYKSCPTFYNYMVENLYGFPKLFRFYNIPPGGELEPHIDNHANAKNKIAFNIPLLGTKNTTTDYYDTPDDNMESVSAGGFGSLPILVIKDRSRLVLIDSLELDQPTLVRTDRIHSVTNPNETSRLVLSMKLLGNKFEQVYKGKLD